MCDPGQSPSLPPSGGAAPSGRAAPAVGLSGSGAALAAIRAGLAYLNTADAGSMSPDEQAQCLRELERAEAGYTAARARVLAAFTAQGGFEQDGQHCARSWLKWQTRITGGAAAGAVGWMKRLAAHLAVDRALAAGTMSASWAREVCAWSDLLPESRRDDADHILLAAAEGGAALADLAALAHEMRSRCAGPDRDTGDDFGDRSLDLGVTFRGSGRVDGDLTSGCTAALSAVLESLGKKAGPEDVRTATQRRHDALEEACRRLIAAGGLPDRAGQPTQIQLHLTLDQLRGLDGAADAEDAWAAGRAGGDREPGWLSGRAAGDGEPGWLSGRAAEAYACDAQITPIVSGHVDPTALAGMTAAYLAGRRPGCACGRCTCPTSRSPGSGLPDSGPAGPLPPRTLRRLQDTLLRYAADVLSGPAGLAAFLRTGLLAAEFPPAVSLPLDVGAATSTIPPHLRRAVIARDRHCAHPGCRQRPAACQVHHITPRSQGGTTALANLVLLCPFHHLIAIHQWGWTITLNPDGTTTATSPDGRRTLHSHSPPAAAAA
jgi:Domain of unknown function (DUF222)/HNH endonuclease